MARLIFLILIIFLQMACSQVREPAAEADHVSYENLEETETGEDFDVTVERRMSDGNEQSINPDDARNTIGLSWPVQGRITRGYNLVQRKPHLGLDIAAPRGTQIQASHDGIVIYAGNGFRGYGKLVMVEFGDRWATLYSHLSRITVREGQWIKRGQKLGVIGRTGNASGIHLHYEIRYKREPIDPVKYLPNGNSIVAYYK